MSSQTQSEGTTPPPAPPRAPRRYVRRDRGKWLAGVATGMADAFGIDVTVVRVLWVIVTLASFGVGVAAYALFWFAFPSEEHAAPISRFGHMREWSSGYVIGLVLLGIGALIVCGQLFAMRPYHHFGAFAWATLLIGGGLFALLNEADVTNITTADAFAGAVVLIGLVLIVSTRFGRARGLIPIGILLLLATIPATVIDVPITNGMGERHYEPQTIEQVHGTYELGIGHLAIDLRDVSFAGQNTQVDARLGIGQLEIDVPSTVQVRVHAHAGAGTITLFGGTYDNTWPINADYTTPEARTTGVLDIDARVGAGDVEVHRYTPTGVETILQERYP